ncbi:MAG: heparinase II/III family protein [Sphingomonadales bacterium]
MEGHLIRPEGASFPVRAAQNLARGLQRLGRVGPVHRLRLAGRHPLKLISSPEDPWPGSAEEGEMLLEGRFQFAGQELEAEPEALWREAGNGTPKFFQWLHSFVWLRDLAALENEEAARALAEKLVKSWAAAYGDYHREAWSPEITGSRLLNWTFHAPLILSSPDLVYRSRVLNSLARQGRHLRIAFADAPPGAARARALVGLAASGLLLPDGEARAAKAMIRLEKLCNYFVLADGGPRSRTISDALGMAKNLIVLRIILEDRQAEVPEWIQLNLDRILPFIKAMAHGDGTLMYDSGSYSGERLAVRDLARLARTRGGPIHNATIAGYLRLEGGKTRLLFDAGPPAGPGLSGEATAGTFSFELSEGAERIVVGRVARDFLPDLTGESAARLIRRSDAQSTLTIADNESTPIRADGSLGAGLGETWFERNENEEGIWVEAWHDGFAGRFGFRHQRRIYLNAAGTDLRGEDRLLPAPAGWRRFFGLKKSQPCTVSFPLHPKVTASLTEQGSAVILRLGSKKGWVFKARGGDIQIEDGIYYRGFGFGAKTSRIVLKALSDDEGLSLNWSFKKAGTRE